MKTTSPLGVQEDGVVWSVFGWVNVAIPGHLEFDLWPPVRPTADSTLVSRGFRTQLSGAALGPGHGDVSYGYAIDNSGPQHGAATPTLSCAPAPMNYPNHIHCVYEDPAGGPRAPTVDDDMFGTGDGEKHKFARSSPFYGTSRFDARVLVGWSTPARATGEHPHVPSSPF